MANAIYNRTITQTSNLDDEGRQLTLTVRHDKDAKEYRVILSREQRQGIMVMYMPMEDIIILERRPVARYSAKALAGIFAEYEGELENETTRNWALDKELQ